jgi:SAM-dependent methyltransferase
VEAARKGDVSGVVLIGHEPVIREWLPESLEGVRILGLASGGGQQGPLLAAAGAIVTIFDNSPAQLDRDREVAQRERLTIETVLGDMRDLSVFADGSFDVVINPVSNVFCPELASVWAECHRVLVPGGRLLVGFMNPDIFIFDFDALDNRKEFVVKYSIPYGDTWSLTAAELAAKNDQPLEFSHTMSEQVGGQLAAGFVVVGWDEAPHHADLTAKYLPGYFATLAIKR